MNDWEAHYSAGIDPWTSSGLSDTVKELVSRFWVPQCFVMEVGCGTGADAAHLADMGYMVTGLDVSAVAVNQAKARLCNCQWILGDFLSDEDFGVFDGLYDRGFFHNLKGSPQRAHFVERAAYTLVAGGIWINISVSADHHRNTPRQRGLFLTDIISDVEPCFEVLEIKKAAYPTADTHLDLIAWNCVFRRR